MEGRCRLEYEADVRADLLHVVRGERQADGELLMDEPIAKGQAEEDERDQTRILELLGLVVPARGRRALR